MRLPSRSLAAAVLRGIRARGLLSASTVLLTVLAVAGAVLGPAFQVAVSRSYAITRLADAAPALSGLTWTFRPDARYDGAPAAGADRAVAAIEGLAGRGGAGLASFTPLQTQWETERRGGLGGRVSLLAKDGACARLEIEGRCPERAGEVLLLDGDLERAGLAVGARTEVGGVGRVRVVGTYQAPEVSDAYWFDLLRFTSTPARENAATGRTTPYRPAPLVTSAATFRELPADRWLVRVDGPLRVPTSWTLDDLGPTVAAVERWGEVEADVTGGRLVGRSTNDLATVAREVRAEQAVAQDSVAPAVLSLVLVALTLLLRLLLAAGEVRTRELALASLRGVRSRRLWGLGLSEPLALLLLAAPLGVAVGLGLSWGLVRWWLLPGLPVPLPPASLAAAALVLVAAAAVAVLAVGLVLRVSLADRLAGTRRPVAASRWSLVAQLALVAAALVVLSATLGGAGAGERRPGVTDLVLPVLLGVAAGLAVVRATSAAAGWWARRRPDTRSLAGFVAARALSRRAAGSLVILPLTAAMAVGVFAIGVADAAGTWRASVAATRAPADQVWASPLGLAETVDLTHGVDPDGRWLAAAGSAALGSTRLAVVDTPRLARVATWPHQWSPGIDPDEIAAALDRPGEVPEPRGRRIGLRLAADLDLEGGGVGDGPLFVELRLRPFGEDTTRVYLGPFRPDGTSRAAADVPCGDGCALEGISVGGRAALSLSMAGSVRLEEMTLDAAPFERGLVGARWSPSPDAAATSPLTAVTEDGDGVRLEVSDANGAGVIRLSSGGIPERIPVVVGRDVPGGVEALRLPTGDVAADPVLVAESTPFAGPAGVLVDATLLANDRTVYDATLTMAVLARADAPQEVREALASRGLSVATTLPGVRATLDSSAHALALRLYLVVAALVLVMALAGLLVSTAVQLPQRRRDAASLRVVGVSSRAVAGAVWRELLVALGSAAVAGIAAGTLAQQVVLRTVQLGMAGGGTLDAEASTPRVVPEIDPVRLAVLTLLALGVLGAVAIGSALVTVRGSRAATLRENG